MELDSLKRRVASKKRPKGFSPVVLFALENPHEFL
jgi:hypothetical protein